MNTLFSPMLSKQNGSLRPYYFFLAATYHGYLTCRVQFLLDQIMVLNPVLNPAIIFSRNFGRPNFVDRGPTFYLHIFY